MRGLCHELAALCAAAIYLGWTVARRAPGARDSALGRTVFLPWGASAPPLRVRASRASVILDLSPFIPLALLVMVPSSGYLGAFAPWGLWH